MKVEFSKYSQISNFVKIHPVGPEFHADRHDETNSRFSQFGNTTKNRVLNNFVAGSVASFSSLDLVLSFYTFILLDTRLISAHVTSCPYRLSWSSSPSPGECKSYIDPVALEF